MSATTTGSALEHAIGAEGLLAIRLRDGEVRLRAVDGDTVRVRDVNGHDLDQMFGIERGDGSLSLRSARSLEVIVGSRGRNGRHTPELEIDLPPRATVVLEAASGDVNAEGLLGDQRYRTASGDVSLRAVSGRIAVEVVSGDVEIGATGEAQVIARTVSGDIALRASTISTLQLATTSGDMKVAGRLAGPGPFSIETVSGDGLLAPAGDVRMEMTSVTGDLSSEIDGPQIASRGRRSLEIGRGGPVVTFRSMSGDLRVTRPIPAAPPREASALPAPDASPIRPAPANAAIAAAYDEARLQVLRSLERGEVDVAEAGRRLETLDSGESDPPGRVDPPAASEAPDTDV